MNRHTLGAGLLIGLVAGLLLPDVASAVPVFARKYGFDCTMCHAGMPRLNDFGQRFRQNGYQLPGMENQERSVLDSPPPVALRTSAGYSGTLVGEQEAGSEESAFRLNGLDLLSAGRLGPDIGYLLVYVPQVAESRGVAGQEGSLEMASIVFSNLGARGLSVRAGRFEPAFLPFSVKRQLAVSPYEIYETSFPEGIAFAETQSGLELSGSAAGGLRFAAGLLEGGSTNQGLDSPGDLYCRLAAVFGAGEGQTAGQRLGVSGYLGRARPSATVGGDSSPVSFNRIGVDACLNLGPTSLALQYLLAQDDQKLWGDDEDVTYGGGFGELTWLPRFDLAAFVRFDFVDAPEVADQDLRRFTVGGRFYPVDNVALHGEYSYRSVKAVGPDQDDLTTSTVTARADFAF